MVWWNPKTWQADPKWSIMSGMPTVTVRMLFLCVLDILTFFAFAHWGEEMIHAMIANPNAHVDPMLLEIFLGWLAFLSGCHGFSYAGYKTKRKTSWDGNVEEDRAGTVPMDSPTVDPATINPTTGAGTPRQTTEVRLDAQRATAAVRAFDPGA